MELGKLFVCFGLTWNHPQMISPTPQFNCFSVSIIKLKNLFLIQPWKEENRQSRLRQLNIFFIRWMLSLPLSQSSYVGKSDLRSGYCVVLFWKPGTRRKLFCRSAWYLCMQFSPVGAVLPKWNVMLRYNVPFFRTSSSISYIDTLFLKCLFSNIIMSEMI